MGAGHALIASQEYRSGRRRVRAGKEAPGLQAVATLPRALAATALALSLYKLGKLAQACPHSCLRAPIHSLRGPYQNSNFEMIAIPVAIANERARTATLLSMELAATDPRVNETEHFYGADFDAGRS